MHERGGEREREFGQYFDEARCSKLKSNIFIGVSFGFVIQYRRLYTCNYSRLVVGCYGYNKGGIDFSFEAKLLPLMPDLTVCKILFKRWEMVDLFVGSSVLKDFSYVCFHMYKYENYLEIFDFIRYSKLWKISKSWKDIC